MRFTTKRQAISLAADEKQRLESLRRSRTGAKRDVMHSMLHVFTDPGGQAKKHKHRDRGGQRGDLNLQRIQSR